MRDQAIRTVHPSVVTVFDNIDARDAQGQPVALDEAKIAAEITKLKAAHAATQYRRDRANAYPSIGDQLDMIYHAGLGGAAFQAAIAAVKATHPKGTL